MKQGVLPIQYEQEKSSKRVFSKYIMTELSVGA